MKLLSEKQKQLLFFLVEYNQAHQIMPSLQEMIDAMEVKSVSPIQIRLQALEKKGYISRNKGERRAITILDKQVMIYEKPKPRRKLCRRTKN